LKSIEKEEEKSRREVVHVRARRGQATDSHSLAERVILLNDLNQEQQTKQTKLLK